MLHHRRFLFFAGLGLGLSLVMLLTLVTRGDLFASAFSNDQISIERGSLDDLEPAAPVEYEGGVANCRYGVAALGEDQKLLVDDLNSGLYLDFKWRSWDATPNGAQYLPLIKVKENKDAAGNYLGTYYTNPRIDSTDPYDSSTLAWYLRLYPGMLWNIGNEIERGPDPNSTTSTQGDTHADVYAQAYHDVREYIEALDPTARTAFAALVQVTPIRLAYLDAAWQAHIDMYGYPPKVDAWAMHLYILPEVKPDGTPNNIANIPVGMESFIDLAKRESGGDPSQCALDEVYCYAEHDDINVFIEQIVDMRQWMKANGEQNKPLLLTEYSLLYPPTVPDEYGNFFTPERVEAFMDATVNYMETASDPNLGYSFDGGRMVQLWVWFSINFDGAGNVSNLYESDLTPNQLGTLYSNRAGSMAINVNLKPDNAGNLYVATDGSGTADADIWATFRNMGTTHITEPFEVTFYSNSALTNEIGSTTITPDPHVVGCGQRNYRAEVTWSDLAPGYHRYWAKIDSNNDINESNENDNRIMGSVIVDGQIIELPIMIRP